MVKTVTVFAAQSIADGEQRGATIIIGEPFPDASTACYDGPLQHMIDAQAIADALWENLPGGTLDRLVVALMQRKLSLYVKAYPDMFPETAAPQVAPAEHKLLVCEAASLCLWIKDGGRPCGHDTPHHRTERCSWICSYHDGVGDCTPYTPPAAPAAPPPPASIISESSVVGALFDLVRLSKVVLSGQDVKPEFTQAVTHADHVLDLVGDALREGAILYPATIPAAPPSSEVAAALRNLAHAVNAYAPPGTDVAIMGATRDAIALLGRLDAGETPEPDYPAPRSVEDAARMAEALRDWFEEKGMGNTARKANELVALTELTRTETMAKQEAAK